MAVKTAISEQEYLHTTFEGVDQEFRDGELIERSMPNSLHSETQGALIGYFWPLRRQNGLPLFARPELRNRIRASRYLIPDVAVYRERPAIPLPTAKPFIAIEILSPDDKISEVRAKLREYVEWGVEHVWLIDPRRQTFHVCDGFGLRDTDALSVPEAGVELGRSDVFEYGEAG